ncbi:MAG: hypothetical protein WC641_06020 [Patescibacteria group bacterium]
MEQYGLAAEMVLVACLGNLENKVFFSGIFARIVNGAAHNPDYEETVRQYILNLNEDIGVVDQVKILNRFNEISQAAKCSISNFRWWDIVPRDHLLLADLLRKDRTYSILFYWRRTDKSLNGTLHCTSGPRVLKHLDPPRIEFEAATYQEVKAQFTAWLAAPCNF